MVYTKIALLFGLLVVMVNGQRSPYAGSRPNSGYKDKFQTPSNTANNVDSLANRFSDQSGTTQRLPHDAYGDAVAVNYLNSLPEDKRPFWLVNYQAIEAIRNTSGGPTVNQNPLANRFGSQSSVPSSPNRVVVGEAGFVGLMPITQNQVPVQQNQQQFPVQQNFNQGNVVAGNPLGNRGSFAGSTNTAGGLSLGVPTGSRGHFQG